MKNTIKLTTLATLILSSQAFASQNVVRPFQSPRTSAMGGVRLTTGLYDENFFGNPARVTANPGWRFTVLTTDFESGIKNIGIAGDLLSSGDAPLTAKLAEHAGENVHTRVQASLFNIYLPKVGNRYSLAFAPIILSTQTDLNIHRSYNIDPQVIGDVGSALTFGGKFLENDALSVGLTGHVWYRVSSNSVLTMSDLLKGASLSPLNTGGQGAQFDTDLGATYVIPWKPAEDIELTGAVTFSNLLGGGFKNLGLQIVDGLDNPPIRQNRALGFGVAARKPTLWKFTDATLALEFQDIGNNGGGSFWRDVHLGYEQKLGVLMMRGGINQGYLSGGLGVFLKVFTFDATYYAEEMHLNVGDYADHRLAVRIGFQI